MRITASARAAEVVAEMATRRSGTLTVTIGTGCCESTAPFLYEDFLPGADMEPVGAVPVTDGDDVVIWAPEYLRRLYPGDQGPQIEVADELAESLSVETELGVRLVLRGSGIDSTGEPETCAVPAGPAAATSGAASSAPEERVLRPVTGTLPPELQSLRFR